jgi:hypothetical protein
MVVTIHKTAPSPYDSMIQSLKDQRAKLDAAISALEALKDSGAPVPAAAAASEVATVSAAIPSTVFRAMSIPDAAIKLLKMRDREMRNPEIATELKNGGLIMGSKDAVNTIGSVLTRRANEVGDIVKVGRGKWALREWTKFRPRPKTEGDSSNKSNEDRYSGLDDDNDDKESAV